MDPVLLIDFGSTNTKVTAVDLTEAKLLGTAAAYTTVETDVGEGLAQAMRQLEKECGIGSFSGRFACSSAAGGLRMVTVGLVPALTAEAARLASLGAGAKVVRVYAYQLTEEDIEEINGLNPDILLLTGGVDGGNSKNILRNAQALSECKGDFPIILAGNRTAVGKCEALLSTKHVIRCPNVMPRLNELNIEPVQQAIRTLFLERIVLAKGLSKQDELISGIMMPTPSAVKRAMELLSEGYEDIRGFGELVAVDLGGATTDVYSVAEGMPENDSILLKGMVEPRSKRTVEGDIGMRYSAEGVLEAVGAAELSALSGISESRVAEMVTALSVSPDRLPQSSEEENLDFALAGAAVKTAVARHCGTMESVYTLAGPALVQTGKDLQRVKAMILTGGAIIHNSRAEEIAAHAAFDPAEPMSLRPKKPDIYIDRSYILSAMGLLAEEYPRQALKIMKEQLIGADEAH